MKKTAPRRSSSWKIIADMRDDHQWEMDCWRERNVFSLSIRETRECGHHRGGECESTWQDLASDSLLPITIRYLTKLLPPIIIQRPSMPPRYEMIHQLTPRRKIRRQKVNFARDGKGGGCSWPPPVVVKLSSVTVLLSVCLSALSSVVDTAARRRSLLRSRSVISLETDQSN